MVSLVAGVGNFAWGMALAFILSLVILSALLLVASFPRRSLDLEKTAAKLRTFKERTLEMELRVTSRRRRGLPDVSLDAEPEGLEASVEREGGAFKLQATSKFAGAFTGVRVKIGVGDPFGIFRRYEVRELATVFEFLPSFLIAGRQPMLVSAAMLGDYPAGRSGFGQEFYSAEAYTSSHGMKDIMWKRLARSPSESPMARVGEANIPERLTVALIEQMTAPSRKNPSWMNLTTEAVARIGVSAVSTGSTLRLIHLLRSRKSVSEAGDLVELADLIMSLWREHARRQETSEELDQADIIVAGVEEMGIGETRTLVMRKPTVMLSYGQAKPAVGPNVVNFTGKEDISRLVVGVLSR